MKILPVVRAFSLKGLLLHLFVLPLLIACGGSGGANNPDDFTDGNGSEEPSSLATQVTFPTTNSNLGGVRSTIVSGKITSKQGTEITASHGVTVQVNGLTAAFDETHPEFWSVEVPVSIGENTLDVSIVDAEGGTDYIQSVFSNALDPESILAAAYNSETSQLYFGRYGVDAIYVLNLINNEVTELYSEETPESLQQIFPRDMVYDLQTQQILLLNYSQLIGVDPTTGVRRVVAELPSASWGEGSIKLDPNNARAFYLDQSGIHSIDLNTGEMELVMASLLVDEAGIEYAIYGRKAFTYDPIEEQFFIITTDFVTNEEDITRSEIRSWELGTIFAYDIATQTATLIDVEHGLWNLSETDAIMVSDDELYYCGNGSAFGLNIRTFEYTSIIDAPWGSPRPCSRSSNDYVPWAVDRTSNQLFFVYDYGTDNVYRGDLENGSVSAVDFPSLSAGSGTAIGDFSAIAYDQREQRLFGIDRFTSAIINLAVATGDRTTAVARTIDNLDSFIDDNWSWEIAGIGVWRLEYHDNKLVYVTSENRPSSPPELIVQVDLVSQEAETLFTWSDAGFVEYSSIWGFSWDTVNRRMLALNRGGRWGEIPTFVWLYETNRTTSDLDIEDFPEGGDENGGYVISDIDHSNNRIIAFEILSFRDDMRIVSIDLSTGAVTPIWSHDPDTTEDLPAIERVKSIKLDIENNRALILTNQLVWIDLVSGETSTISSTLPDGSPRRGPRLDSLWDMEIDLNMQRAYILGTRQGQSEILVVDLLTGARAILAN